MPNNVSCLVIFVFKSVGALWGREAENAALYLYRKAQILASEVIRPPPGHPKTGPECLLLLFVSSCLGALLISDGARLVIP